MSKKYHLTDSMQSMTLRIQWEDQKTFEKPRFVG